MWLAAGILALLALADAKMNVLFIAVDDLRPQLGVMGPGVRAPSMITPEIDALARQSLLCTKNYVQQAVCSCSRTSLLTSRRPDSTRVWDLWQYWRDINPAGNFTSLPQWFREQGYHTEGMGKIFHGGETSYGFGGHAAGATCFPSTLTRPGDYAGVPPGCRLGDDGGYGPGTFAWSVPYWHAPDEYLWSDPRDGAPVSLEKHWRPNPPTPGGIELPLGMQPDNAWTAVPPEIEAAYPLPDTQIAQRAVGSLKRFSSAAPKPFFLGVGFKRPHLPFVAPAAKFDLYPMADIELPEDQLPPSGMPSIAWSGYGELTHGYADAAALKSNSTTSKPIGAPGSVLPPLFVRQLRRAYYASVSHLDDQVGAVLTALESNGFAKNTVVAFWGDHGWQLGEHGEWCKHTNFELATHAPLIIKVPGLTDGGIRTKQYTEHLDVFPTLADAAVGVTLPPCPRGKTSLLTRLCTMGHSLVPLIKAERKALALGDSVATASPFAASFSQYPRGLPRNTDALAAATSTSSPACATALAAHCGTPEVTANITTCWNCLQNSVIQIVDDAKCTGPEMQQHCGGLGVGVSQPNACYRGGCVMGYTMVATLNNTEFRYTEWPEFNTIPNAGDDKSGYMPNWGKLHGIELYDHSSDPGENINRAHEPGQQHIVSVMSEWLHRGPVPSGWGPWQA